MRSRTEDSIEIVQSGAEPLYVELSSLSIVTAMFAKHNVSRQLDEDIFLASAMIFNISSSCQDCILSCFPGGIEISVVTYSNSGVQNLAASSIVLIRSQASFMMWMLRVGA